MLVFTLLIRVSLKKLSLTPRMSFLLAMNLHPQASIHCFDIRFCIRFSRYFIPHKPYPTHQEESIIQPEHSKPSVSRSRIVFNYPSRPVWTRSSVQAQFLVQTAGRLFVKLIGVEMERFELLTPCLQGRCSPNWATPPFGFLFNSKALANGLKWTRTTDLTLIRRAL